jgi:hypothetical protein
VGVARADACDVCVIIDEAPRVHVRESLFDKIGRPRAQTVLQLFRLMRESPAGML